MNALIDILSAHVRNYPLLQPRDAVKLLYQSEFGGGHLIPDPATALAYLQKELCTVQPDPDKALFEEIGGGKARLQLAAMKAAGLSAQTVCRIFVESANACRGSMEVFLRSLELLRGCAENGMFAFTLSELDAYLDVYKAQGCPAVSHSDTYRGAYAPAYRVIDARFERLLPLLVRTDALLSEKKRIILCLDGRAASGKTTAAELLERLYGCGTVHMDDFFLPPPLRTAQRYAQPGGNVHYERFAEEVLPNLRAHSVFRYRIFDCGELKYAAEAQVDSSKPVTVVEGAYCLHPIFGEYFDLAAFFDVDPAIQQARILERNGSQMLEMFRQKWIPMENSYIDAYGIKDRCSLIL